jgi:hypothetical protein
MTEFDRIIISEQDVPALERTLSSLNLKKKVLRRIFVGEGIEVRYPGISWKEYLCWPNQNDEYYNRVIISGTDEKKAKEIIRTLSPANPIFLQ